MSEAARETIIRWDRETDEAVLYTADPAEMRRWARLGYPVTVYGTTRGTPTARSWGARVPITAVALLPMKAGEVRVSRWLEPPTVWAQKPQASRAPEPTDGITVETDTESPTADGMAAG